MSYVGSRHEEIAALILLALATLDAKEAKAA